MKRQEPNNNSSSVNPSERGGQTNQPGNNSQKQSENQEGTIRKAGDSASEPSSYDDDFEVAQEDNITREEAKTEDENS